MVGLPFPNSVVDTREPSWDHGTPFSGSGDIPIDPALSDGSLDPALFAENGVSAKEETPYPPAPYPPYHHVNAPQYPEGPQGDPFAPPPPAYVPVEEPVPLPAKPLKKRKRPPAREEECGFCSGNDSKNRDGQPELMVSCVDCGRSGHPSCMGLDNMGDAMRNYEWQCATCKSCSVCRRRGNAASMLICDHCDRGWHMSCFNPPYREPPEGRWHCPSCPPVDFDPQEELIVQSGEAQELPSHFPAIRESSVASSSHYAPPFSDVPDLQDHVLTTDASEVEYDPADPADPSLRRSTRKRQRSRKGKEVDMNAADDDQAETPVTPAPAIRRLRIRLSSPPPPPAQNETPPTIRLRVPARAKGRAREDPLPDDVDRGLFDDILSPEDRDTRETTIGLHDHERFERSRANAELRLLPRFAPEPPETPVAGPSTRPLRSHATPRIPSSSMSPAPAATPGPQAMYPNGLRIRKIRFGEYDIDTWYDAPFPEEYAAIPDGRLWMCEFCLKYMKSRFSASRHQLKCKVRCPPGDEIYRDGRISIYEVDGRKNKIYCQNLCLLSKMFLDHKSLFYDVEPFLFYVMTEMDDAGAHFVGYFSKEKLSPKNYNVSCIMTLPVRQRQGWGNLLIDFSYLLSKKEQRAGSPEKPLSALGALGYKNYWTLSIMRYLRTAPPNPSLEDISRATSMTVEDIYSTLLHLNMISVLDSAQPPKPLPGQSIKFPKGRKNGIARKHLQRTQTHDDEKAKGPFVPPTRYKVRWDAEEVNEYLARWEAKGYLKLKPEMLKWSPFILARAKKTQSFDGDAALGQSKGDGTRSASADVQSSQSAADGVEFSAGARTLVEKTRSPAFALFDDDDVEIVRTSAPRDTIPSETADAGGSHVRSSSAEPTEMVRTNGRDVDGQRSIRRLRSRDSVLESPPMRRRPHTPRQDTSSQLDRRRNPQRPRHLDGPSTPLAVHENGTAPSVDDDAALAARLAMELDHPRRQLRTRRSSTDQQSLVQKRLVPPSRSVSPKKRRRVDSSPEVEMTPTPRSPVTRRTGRNGDSSAVDRNSEPQTPSRRSSRVANGHFATRSATSAVREEEEEEEEQSMPAESLYGDAAIMTDGYATAEPEDADTPVTGATAASRHSVPSDDTMIGGDPARSKVSPLPRLMDPGLDALNVLALLAAGQIADRDANANANARAGVDDGGEEDAEGEEDLDAEGELDDNGDS
ncbi:hypothetical protein K466DRAFT_36586 [Polyporus arcularius HHB13444]|uniref:Histone acetyltransferase n=1 Tax=Polyporus arcularius HHB13444 TaxID=1314778 RepID=A0A5C3Q1D2_9APHY|nr:hypothetical protein K466DRAFT_36586 [Polyporus arcularius HHB13444]